MQAYLVPISIIIGALIVAQQVHWAFEALIKHLETQRTEMRVIKDELKRIGDKLDSLWSPVKGISNALWRDSNAEHDID